MVTTVNRPPFGGYFSASSFSGGSSGVVFDTEFSLAAVGWTDDNADDLPLIYAFLYDSEGSPLPLAPASSLSTLWTTLPVAGSVLVHAQIKDQFGATTRTSKARHPLNFTSLSCLRTSPAPLLSLAIRALLLIFSQLIPSPPSPPVTQTPSLLSSLRLFFPSSLPPPDLSPHLFPSPSLSLPSCPSPLPF